MAARNRLDRRRADHSIVFVSVEAAAEGDRQIRLRNYVVAVDPDRGRALKAEELGVLRAAHEYQLDRGLDYPLVKDGFEVAACLLEVGAVLDGQ